MADGRSYIWSDTSRQGRTSDVLVCRLVTDSFAVLRRQTDGLALYSVSDGLVKTRGGLLIGCVAGLRRPSGQIEDMQEPPG